MIISNVHTKYVILKIKIITIIKNLKNDLLKI